MIKIEFSYQNDEQQSWSQLNFECKKMKTQHFSTPTIDLTTTILSLSLYMLLNYLSLF